MTQPQSGLWFLLTLSGLGCTTERAAPAVNRDESAARAKVSACLGIDAAASMTFFWPPRLGGIRGTNEMFDCVVHARDCQELKACAGYSDVGCNVTERRCVDNVAVECRRLTSGLLVSALDDCAANPDGNNECSIGADDKGEVHALCSAGTCTETRCDGDTLVRCYGGTQVREDCSRDGRTCLVSNTTAVCSFERECSQDTCDGDRLNLCYAGHVGLAEECNQMIPGTRCVEEQGGAQCRAPAPAAECENEFDFQSWCDGHTAFTCFSGVRVELDCAKLAGGACHSWTTGTLNDVQRAGCQGTAGPDNDIALFDQGGSI